MKRTLAMALLSIGTAFPVCAQTRQADSTMTIERSVGVSEISKMIFNATTSASPSEGGPEGVAAVSSSNEPAVMQLSGDPDRIYRIKLPAGIIDPATNTVIGGFTVWSENSGDITETLSARMDDQGRDTLRITGVMRATPLSVVSAAVPITVNYE